MTLYLNWPEKKVLKFSDLKPGDCFIISDDESEESHTYLYQKIEDINTVSGSYTNNALRINDFKQNGYLLSLASIILNTCVKKVDVSSIEINAEVREVS